MEKIHLLLVFRRAVLKNPQPHILRCSKFKGPGALQGPQRSAEERKDPRGLPQGSHSRWRRKEHLAKARLQEEARKAPYVQCSGRSDKHEVKGESRGAEEMQKTEMERRKSNICIQWLTQGCAQLGVKTISKDTLLISIAFLKNWHILGDFSFRLSQ